MVSRQTLRRATIVITVFHLLALGGGMYLLWKEASDFAYFWEYIAVWCGILIIQLLVTSHIYPPLYRISQACMGFALISIIATTLRPGVVPPAVVWIFGLGVLGPTGYELGVDSVELADDPSPYFGLLIRGYNPIIFLTISLSIVTAIIYVVLDLPLDAILGGGGLFALAVVMFVIGRKRTLKRQSPTQQPNSPQ